MKLGGFKGSKILPVLVGFWLSAIGWLTSGFLLVGSSLATGWILRVLGFWLVVVGFWLVLVCSVVGYNCFFLVLVGFRLSVVVVGFSFDPGWLWLVYGCLLLVRVSSWLAAYFIGCGRLIVGGG